MANPVRASAARPCPASRAAWLVALPLLAACGSVPIEPSETQLPAPQAASPRDIPPPVAQPALPPPPQPAAPLETYSVVVNEVPVHELLFALARDAKLNVDIHPGVTGNVTLNGVNQTLPQLLDRVSRQTDTRFELDGPNLSVMPDTPFLRNYRVDYVNVSRETISNVTIATQISTAGGGAGHTPSGGGSKAPAPAGAADGAGGNNSTASVTNQAGNRFWQTLVQNIRDLLRETDKILPEGSSETVVEQTGTRTTTGTGAQTAPPRKAKNHDPLAASPHPATLQNSGTTVTRRSTFREAASVIANPETGVMAVRATGRQHEKVQEFLDQVMASARRQVLIEATVVEVQLSDRYQQGIDWTRLSRTGEGFTLKQQPAGTGSFSTGATPGGINPAIFFLSYTNPDSRLGNLNIAVSLLESFGKTKVLSSPKISVLNNQSAVLKVVDNRVYFTIEVQTTPATQSSPAITTYSTTVHTVPEGFVMNVTPQIDEGGTVTLNVRPTISRIINYVNDPSPALAAAGVVSSVPEIQTREMESLLKVDSGQIAIMGGLMQDSTDRRKDGVPGLARLPLLGDLFSYRNDAGSKSELVIFLRPVVIRQGGLNGDYRELAGLFPRRDFFREDKGSTGETP